MSLEPVILNEVQLKAAETQTKIDTQTQTLVDDNATKRDEINAHSSTEAGQTIAGINSETAAKLAEQTTTLQQTVTDSEAVVTQRVIQEAARVIDRNIEATDSSTTDITAHVSSETDRAITSNASAVNNSRDEVNSTTQAAKNEVKSHVTTEANRVIAAAQSGGSSIVRILRFSTQVSAISSLTLPSHPIAKRSVNITSMWTNTGNTTQTTRTAYILIAVASTTKLSASQYGITPASIKFEVIDYA